MSPLQDVQFFSRYRKSPPSPAVPGRTRRASIIKFRLSIVRMETNIFHRYENGPLISASPPGSNCPWRVEGSTTSKENFVDVRCHNSQTKRPERPSEEAPRLIYSSPGLGAATQHFQLLLLILSASGFTAMTLPYNFTHLCHHHLSTSFGLLCRNPNQSSGIY